MNFPNTAVFLGTAALVWVQPQVAASLSPNEVTAIAKEITVLVEGQAGSGSGVIIQRPLDTYLVLTAAHVVNSTYPGEEAHVTTNDGTVHEVNTRRIISLPGVDLAVIEFRSNNNYPIAEIGDSDAATELTGIFISGFPHSDASIEQGFFITPGSIASRNRDNADGYELVYDNVTRIGMSGGAILNEDGQLVGIHGRAEGKVGRGARVKAGLNLGIPIKTFLQLAARAGINFNPSPSSTPRPP